MRRLWPALGLVLTAGILPGVALAAGPAPGPALGPPPGMMRPPGARAQHPPAADEMHSPELDALAKKPYRPSWAPLPLFRGDVVATPLLHELLASANADDRARAAFILGRIACPDSLPLLAEHLKDPVRAVRVHAGIALASMGDARGLPICRAVLTSDPAWVRYWAVCGLWQLNSAEARAALKAALPGQSVFIAETIRGALGTPFVAPPPVPSFPKGAQVLNKPSSKQIWEQAADVLTRESDWWWHRGNYEQAIRCHLSCTLLDPTYVEDYAVAAWLQWSLGRGDEAVATLHQATAAAPRDPDAWFALGEHHFIRKQYALAEAPLARAAELGGDDLALRTYAHCLEKLGKLQQSLAEWDALLARSPGDLVARHNRDRVQQRIKG